MFHNVFFPQGTAHYYNKRGKKVNVESAYVYVPGEPGCEPKFECDVDVLRFRAADGTVKDIPLEQLFNYLNDQGVIDTTAPTAPTNIAFADTTDTTSELSWTAGTDANLLSHLVYVDGVQVAEVTAGTNAYTLTGLTASTTYSISVRAKDVGGNLSTALTGSVTTTAAS